MKNKETMMEEFLVGFEQAMKQEKDRRAELEKEVVAALTKYSSLLVQTHNMPRYKICTNLLH
jgi:hypothetical protein